MTDKKSGLGLLVLHFTNSVVCFQFSFYNGKIDEDRFNVRIIRY